MRWEDGKGGRVMRRQGGKGRRVVRWKGGRFLVLFKGGEHRVSRRFSLQGLNIRYKLFQVNQFGHNVSGLMDSNSEFKFGGLGSFSLIYVNLH